MIGLGSDKNDLQTLNPALPCFLILEWEGKKSFISGNNIVESQGKGPCVQRKVERSILFFGKSKSFFSFYFLITLLSYFYFALHSKKNN